MNDEPEFKMSQDFEMVPPQRKKAYPILVEEWEHLKEKIRSIKDNANFYHTSGSILLGVAGSSFFAALAVKPLLGEDTTSLDELILWAIFAVALICGGLSIFFGRAERKVQNSNAHDVVEHMELIEKRYESET